MLTVIAICLIILAIVNIVFGISLFVGNRRNRQVFLFMVFNIAVALWSFGIGLFYLSTSADMALWYVKLYYIAAALIAYSLVLFVTEYVMRKISLAVLLLASIPFLVILGFIVSPGGLIGDITLQPSPSVELVRGVYIAYAVYFVSYFIAAIIVAWRGYFLATENRRNDKIGTLYILVAITVSGIFGMFFNLFLPLVGNYSLIWIGPLGSIWMVTFIAVAVIRHSLFDIRVTAAKIAAFLLTFSVFFGVYYFVGYVMKATSLFEALTAGGQEMFRLTIMSLLALFGRSLLSYFETMMNALLFRGSYSVGGLADAISQLVTSATGLQQLLDSSAYQIARELSAESAVMVVRLEDGVISTNYGKTPGIDAFLIDIVAKMPGEKSPVLVEYIGDGSVRQILEKLGIILYIPLSYNGELIGFLGLGERQQGGYNERDVHTLTAINAELAIAIQNALNVEKIKTFNDSLRGEVDRATAELRESNQKLKAMDKTKDEFISLTSHQLRTPLTTIKGYISMLLDGDVGDVTPQQRKLLEEAFNSSQRMVHLISDFLNISRIQTGKFMVELTDVNLAEVLDEEIEQLRISASSREITLQYDKPVGFPSMQLDESKIRQVMMNFIDNAIYYSPAGSTITVILSHTASTVEFKVIDQGIGVPKAEQHKLFAKFSRASNARKQRPDGTGIGLFMAKKVIVALGGAILFQSEEGKGSTFGFRLNKA